MRLHADIVTASACVSGLGKLVSGEGMVGLLRAFFYAGTRSVCVSLWNVADESTADLMRKFYYYLIKENLDKAEALRQAKLDIIKEGKWKNPFYWAAFILVGDWK